MEAAVLDAEARVGEARRRAEDSIATDAEVDRLYARWAALDEKQK